MIDWQTQDGVWNCDPANVVPTTGDYGQPATLADVGKIAGRPQVATPGSLRWTSS